MIVILAALLLGQPATVCRSFGPSVRCELGPAKAVAVALAEPRPLPAVARPRPARASSRNARHISDRAGTTSATPPSEAEITTHIGSLLEIGDCTGARSYAAQAGPPGLADRTFATCVQGTKQVGLLTDSR